MESTRLIETVKRAQNGDEEALLALYLDIHQNVYYLALKMMKNPNDAEDMTQEVFITIQEKIAGLHEPAAFYRWINQITANKCTSALRKRRELNGFEEDSDVWVQEENDHMLLPDKAFDDEETRRLIMEVIDNLPVNQRVCVYFYYYEQLTISQIAETLETNENTVKSRLALARGKIKAELERKEREEGVRLYAVPLALTPILRQAMQEFTMPEGVTERMWENISQAEKNAPPDSSDSNKPDSSGGNTPSQGNPPANGAAGTAATSAGMTLATKIIIGAVAAAVVTAGAVFLPPLLNSPDNSNTPGVTDTSPTQSGTEAPANTFDISDNISGEEGANLTGQPKLTLQDFEDWGFSKGMTVDELRDKGLIYDNPNGMTLNELLDDIDQNPDNYNRAVPFTENPEIWVDIETWLIDTVYVRESESFLGPRGLAVGMTAEEVVNLFYCDNPLIMEYVKNPSQNTAPEFGAKMYIDSSESLEGSINILDGQIESLNYGILRNTFLNIYMENNRVKEFRVYFVYMDDN